MDGLYRVKKDSTGHGKEKGIPVMIGPLLGAAAVTKAKQNVERYNR